MLIKPGLLSEIKYKDKNGIQDNIDSNPGYAYANRYSWQINGVKVGARTLMQA